MHHTRYWIGIDLHQRVIQVCVLDAAGEKVFEKRYLGGSLEEGLAAVEEIARWKDGGRLAVEAVGVNRWFVRACRKAGLEVTVVDPRKLDLKKSGRKTDRLDAYEIARRLRLGDVDANAKSYFPTEREYGIRRLLRVRHQLVRERTRAANTIRSFLRADRVPATTSKLYGPRVLAKLRELSWEQEHLAAAFVAMLDHLESTHRCVETLNKQIQSLAKKDPDISTAIPQLPYCGPVTASTIVAELGDVTRFRNAKSVARSVLSIGPTRKGPRIGPSADHRPSGSDFSATRLAD